MLAPPPLAFSASGLRHPHSNLLRSESGCWCPIFVLYRVSEQAIHDAMSATSTTLAKQATTTVMHVCDVHSASKSSLDVFPIRFGSEVASEEDQNFAGICFFLFFCFVTRYFKKRPFL